MANGQIGAGYVAALSTEVSSTSPFVAVEYDVPAEERGIMRATVIGCSSSGDHLLTSVLMFAYQADGTAVTTGTPDTVHNGEQGTSALGVPTVSVDDTIAGKIRIGVVPANTHTQRWTAVLERISVEEDFSVA